METSQYKELEVSQSNEGLNVNLPEIELGELCLALYEIKE